MKTLAIILIVSAVLLVFAAPVLDAPQSSKVVQLDIEEFGDAAIVFRNFEKAWREGNAQAIVSLAQESPVLVEIRGLESKGGRFTKPQLLYILKAMFANTKQVSFEFVKFHNIEKQERCLYGIAQRSYRPKGGDVYKDKVYVTLVKEGSRWAVAEIKSTW